MKEGFDVGLEMSGHESGLKNMLDHMAHGGKVGLLALCCTFLACTGLLLSHPRALQLAILGIPSKPFPIDMDRLVFKGLTMKGIYGREMFETWYKMRNMLVGGLAARLSPVITHRYKFEEFQVRACVHAGCRWQVAHGMG